MNSVDKVRTICKERKIPIYKLEKELGFANGYIGQLRKGTFPDDRLAMIAEHLDVPVEYLMGTQKKEKSTADDGLSENVKALIDFAKTVPDDKAELVLKLMRTIVEDE